MAGRTPAIPGQFGPAKPPNGLTIENIGAFEKVETLPEPENWLNEDGKNFWNEYGGMLVVSGILRAGDKYALAAMSQAQSELIRGERKVEKEGITISDNRGAVRAHPAMSTIKAARADLLAYGRLFGLSPMSRKQLNIREEEKPVDDGWGDDG